MKIYIATPVNARTEATLEEKQKAARQRCYALREEIAKHYPDAECWSSVTNIVIARKGLADREADIMGTCVRHVMQSDIVFFDWGYENSKGCTVEHITALIYGKKIIHANDLNIEPESLLTKYGVEPKKESQPIEQAEEWKPAESIDEAAAIVRAHPITKDMTYEERLAAQKARFGL